MAYSPKRKATTFEPSPSGVGKISLLKGKKLGVHFSPDNKNDWAGEKFKVSSWPDYVASPKLLPDRQWYIRLGNDEKSIFAISPTSGMFTGRCVGFSSKEGEPPVPKTSNPHPQYGSYQFFNALIEITDGDEACVGMTLSYHLRYNFGEDADGLVEYTNWGSDSATHSPRLDEFLGMVGAWDKGEIQFSDNILPTLQKRILRANRSFQFVMKDGWIDTLYEDNEPRPADPAWDDDEKPKKKKKKKDKKVVETVEDLDWD